ncbi:MAG: RNA polymerase sigma factor [Pseudomonadota bacterium]
MLPKMPLDVDQTLSDDALMVMFANGDPSAARELTSRHLSTVLAFARRMMWSDAEAEDVAQEAMMRLWKTAGAWRPGEAKVTTWLYRVTRNLCIDRLRQRQTVGLDAVAEPLDETPSVQSMMEQSGRVNALYDALNQLPERQRDAVVLRHIEGLGNPEIAEVLEISVDAVESLTARGKRALKALLVDKKMELGWS